VIPALLGTLAIEGAIVTVDAMGCQRVIAAKILAEKETFELDSRALAAKQRNKNNSRDL
jgi:predicted transposase YbfD/YdcC